MKRHMLVVAIASLGLAGLGNAFAKNDDAGDKGKGKGAAAVSTLSKGETAGQLIRDAAHATREADAVADIASGLRDKAAAGVTSAATVAGYLDMVEKDLRTIATTASADATKLLASGMKKTAGHTKAELTAAADAAKADAKSLMAAHDVCLEVAAAAKAAGAGGHVIGTYEKLAHEARRLARSLEHDASELAREAAHLAP